MISCFSSSTKDNTYQTSSSTFRNVGYRSGDRIKFKSHPYRAEGVVTSGGFTPTVKFIYKPISGTTGSRPTPETVDVGLQYLNTTTNTMQMWDGTTWRETGADNWGTQTVSTTARFSGNGAVSTPLDLASQGASTGQVLKYNGTNWVPDTDNTGGGGSVLPLNQLGYGTGSGITSSADLQYDPTNLTMSISASSNTIQPTYKIVTDTTLSISAQTSPSEINVQGMTKRVWTDPRYGRFGNYYQYITWSNSINNTGSQPDTTGNMLFNRGFNFGGFPNYNPKRPTVYESIEQSYRFPGENNNFWEWHIEAVDTLGRVFRPWTMAHRYDGKGGGFGITSDNWQIFKHPGDGVTGSYWEYTNMRTGEIQHNHKHNLKINNNTTNYAIIEKLSSNNGIYRNVVGSLPNNKILVGDSSGVQVYNEIRFQSNNSFNKFKSSDGAVIFDSIELTVKSTSDRGLNLTKAGVVGGFSMGYSNNGFIGGTSTFTEQLFISKTAPNYSIYVNTAGKVGINNNGPGVGTLDIVQRSNDFLGGLGIRSTGNNYGVFFRDNSNNMFLTTNANTEFKWGTGGVFTAYARLIGGVPSNTANQTSIGIENNTGLSQLYRYTSTPESAITGNPGDLTLVNGSGTGNLYIKKSGTGNTGWSGVVTSTTGTATLMREESFTATASQTTFTLSSYTPAAVSGTSVPIRVYRNGVKLKYVASGPTVSQFSYSGAVITVTACAVNDIITIEYLN